MRSRTEASVLMSTFLIRQGWALADRRGGQRLGMGQGRQDIWLKLERQALARQPDHEPYACDHEQKWSVAQHRQDGVIHTHARLQGILPG